jgi:hypothetical protein
MILDHSDDNSADAYDVRAGSFASVWPDYGDFRSTPVNGHSQDRRACLKGATIRHPSRPEILAHVG